ncbi:type III-B CRISPR-associated protein Cas10/Cmr2 [Kutzneria sp. 744]|uniref:Cas10/Cmr2 second palm domain-containing protein n=1 Tax=Kutzneria sp. (strain 744) TaxID=345341 RepID=UPI0004AFFAEA|nr:type III-B CRISPR-associated protein Cas10/Cmr2 [Kutzneria sp. 744]
MDLVLIAIGGVQKFIAESRSTADVAGASLTVQELARTVARTVESALGDQPSPAGLVVPEPTAIGTDGVTSRIVFVAEHQQGPPIAMQAADAVADAWRNRLARVFRGAVEAPTTPGFPDVCWVCVSGPLDTDADYRQLWDAGRAALLQRRRSRIFTHTTVRNQTLCPQSPQFAAVSTPPVDARSHEKDRGEMLSAASWLKRLAARTQTQDGFPSTAAIASASYRRALITTTGIQADLAVPVRELARAAAATGGAVNEPELAQTEVPDTLRPLAAGLGAWVHPDAWDLHTLRRENPRVSAQTVTAGYQAATRIHALAVAAGAPALTSYYAIVVQDMDKLGTALGRLGRDEQQAASRALLELGHAERATVQGRDGFTVYAGGDDLLAFCPAAQALALAEDLRRLIAHTLPRTPLAARGPGGAEVTASTAVVYAHMSSPLGEAMATAREAIEQAKHSGRDAVAVVARRRGGERARTVQPWHIDRSGREGDGNAAQLLRAITPSAEEFSPGFASDLERDRRGLVELAEHAPAVLLKELTRLIARHGTPNERAGQRARAMHWLAIRERHRATAGFDPLPSALLARFLAQECR